MATVASSCYGHCHQKDVNGLDKKLKKEQTVQRDRHSAPTAGHSTNGSAGLNPSQSYTWPSPSRPRDGRRVRRQQDHHSASRLGPSKNGSAAPNPSQGYTWPSPHDSRPSDDRRVRRQQDLTRRPLVRKLNANLKDQQFMLWVERVLGRFVTSRKTSFRFPPMLHNERALVHLVAEHYAMYSSTDLFYRGWSVKVERNEKTVKPDIKLKDLISLQTTDGASSTYPLLSKTYDDLDKQSKFKKKTHKLKLDLSESADIIAHLKSVTKDKIFLKSNERCSIDNILDHLKDKSKSSIKPSAEKSVFITYDLDTNGRSKFPLANLLMTLMEKGLCAEFDRYVHKSLYDAREQSRQKLYKAGIVIVLVTPSYKNAILKEEPRESGVNHAESTNVQTIYRWLQTLKAEGRVEIVLVLANGAGMEDIPNWLERNSTQIFNMPDDNTQLIQYFESSTRQKREKPVFFIGEKQTQHSSISDMDLCNRAEDATENNDIRGLFLLGQPLTWDRSKLLEKAVSLEHLGIVIYFLTFGVDLNIRNHTNRRTLLHQCAEIGNSLIVRCLLEYGASVNECDNNNETPLHLCSKHGFYRCVNYVLSFGANVNQGNEKDKSPLHLAEESQHDKVMQVLLAYGADVNKTDANKWTPLHVTCKQNFLKGTTKLLSNFASATVCDNSGKGPLTIAVEQGHTSLIREILYRTDIDINNSNAEGQTYLHLAASMGNRKVVEVLLKAGANANKRDHANKTALDFAIQSGHRECKAVLVKYGAKMVNTEPLELAQSPWKETTSACKQKSEKSKPKDENDTPKKIYKGKELREVYETFKTNSKGFVPASVLFSQLSSSNETIYIYIDEAQTNEGKVFVDQFLGQVSNVETIAIPPPEDLAPVCSECGESTCPSVSNRTNIMDAQDSIVPGSPIFAIQTDLYNDVTENGNRQFGSINDISKYCETQNSPHNQATGFQHKPDSKGSEQTNDDCTRACADERLTTGPWSIGCLITLHDRNGKSRNGFVSTCHNLGEGIHANLDKGSLVSEHDVNSKTAYTFLTEIQRGESKFLVILGEEHYGIYDKNSCIDILFIFAQSNAVTSYKPSLKSSCSSKIYDSLIQLGQVRDSGICVTKHGFASGWTYGKIAKADLCSNMKGELGEMQAFGVTTLSTRQVQFAIRGDSGSVVLESKRHQGKGQAYGLVWREVKGVYCDDTQEKTDLVLCVCLNRCLKHLCSKIKYKIKECLCSPSSWAFNPDSVTNLSDHQGIALGKNSPNTSSIKESKEDTEQMPRRHNSPPPRVPEETDGRRVESIASDMLRRKDLNVIQKRRPLSAPCLGILSRKYLQTGLMPRMSTSVYRPVRKQNVSCPM